MGLRRAWSWLSKALARPPTSRPAPSAETRAWLKGALGYPDAEVKICRELSTLPGVFAVGLKTGDTYVQRTVITHEGGVWLDEGQAAAAKFLDAWGVAERRPIQFEELLATLADIKGLPGQFGNEFAAGDVRGVGANGVTYAPFKMTMIQGFTPSWGAVSIMTFVRAELIHENGMWTWVISDGSGRPTAWIERARVSLGS